MRVVLTTSNSSLSRETVRLCKDIESLFPAAEAVPRKGRVFARFLAEEAPENSLVIRLDQVDKVRRRLVFVRRGAGSEASVRTTTFSIVSHLLCSSLGEAGGTDHPPELMISNFTESPEDSSVAKEISDVFGGAHPDFDGRQVVSFTKKRGFIFCRKHRYIIRVPEGASCGEQVRCAEVGPRLTLKLQSIEENGHVLYKHTKNTKIKD